MSIEPVLYGTVASLGPTWLILGVCSCMGSCGQPSIESDRVAPWGPLDEPQQPGALVYYSIFVVEASFVITAQSTGSQPYFKVHDEYTARLSGIRREFTGRVVGADSVIRRPHHIPCQLRASFMLYLASHTILSIH